MTVGKLKLREGEGEGKGGGQVFIKFDRALMCYAAEHNISQDITASYFSQKIVPPQDCYEREVFFWLFFRRKEPFHSKKTALK